MRHLHHALVLVAILAAAVPAASYDGELTRATLKRLEGVGIVIEGFGDTERAAGYNEATFRTDVELKLRLAGIKVLTDEERYTTPAMQYLYVQVSTINPVSPTSKGPYSIQVEVNQRVTLSTGERAFASTWSVGSTGMGGLSHIRGSVKDKVDRFINAWLSVNPKP